MHQPPGARASGRPEWVVGPTLPAPGNVLGDLLARSAAAFPEREALVVLGDDGTTVRWTYRQLEAEVARRCHALELAGLHRGDAVLLVATRSPALVPAILALVRSGVTYVPVDPGAPDEHWAYVAEVSGARTLAGARLSPDRAAAVLGPGGRVVDLDAPLPDEPCPPADVLPTALAYVLFTSGSTGRPKGVQVSHANVLHRLPAYLDRPDEPCRYLLHSSMTFDGAVGGLYSTVARGGCLVMVPDGLAGDPGRVAGVVRAERITHLEPVPSWFATLVELARPGDLDSVRKVILGGEVLPPGLVAATRRALPGARLVNDYGPTEVTVAATAFDVPAGWQGDDVPIGRPHPNTAVAVLDEAGRPVPHGAVGELWVAGPCVARGYAGRPDHPAFEPDPATGEPRYRTGDLVRWDDEGLLHFCGRRDRQVKIRGQRIEPEEIETVLGGLPGVSAAAVEVDARGPEERLVAFVGPVPGATLTEEGLLAALAERLPRHLRPAAVVVLDALPLTPGGKVDRRRLPAPPRPAAAAGPGAEPPRDDVERCVAAAFTAVLGAEADRNTDFFGAGGQSLGVARVVARLRDDLGVDVAPADLLAGPTVAALADRVRHRPPAVAGPVLRRRPRPAGYRLPAAARQESFWYLEHVRGGAGRSNLVEALVFPSGTEAGLLHRAVADLVARHAALRTAFELTADGLQQVVHPEVAVPFSDLPAAPDRPSLEALADDFAAAPFDLGSAPLVRAGVASTPEGPALLLVVHHTVADGWSLGLIAEEIAACVRAGGSATDLPVPAVEYADLVEWTAEHTGERRRAAVAYVTDQLHRSAGVGGAVLPYDRPRPAQPDLTGAVVSLPVGERLDAGLTEVAGRLGVTPYAVLAASLGILLARSAGREELVLSGPSSGRGDPALDRVVGCCINTALFRVDVSGDPRFAEVARRVAVEAAAGEPHRWLPVELAMREVGEAVREEAPTVLLNLLEAQQPDLTVPGGRMRRVGRPSAAAYSDLDLYLERRDGELVLDAVYATARFDRGTVEVLVERWLGLLAAALREPDAPVAALPLLTPAEQRRLDEWEGRPAEPVPTTVLDQFRLRVAEEPTAQVVVDSTGTWTRAELWDRAGAVAAWLTANGTRPGEAVVVALDGCADAVAAVVGCWRAAAVPVPVGETLPAARLTAVAAGAGARTVLDRAVMDALPELAQPWEEADSAPRPAAYVLFTSGSTGEPKGVVVGQAAFAASTVARVEAYPDRPPVALVSHDLAFDAGLGIIGWYLWTGGVLVMAREEERLDPELLAGLVHRHGVGQLDIVPSHHRLLLDLAAADSLASLRLVTLGGEACPPSLVSAHRAVLPRATLVNEYGPTECTVWALAHTCTGAETGRVPVGRPIAGVLARVGDAAGHRLPPGVTGELLLGGELLADGYLGDPVRTAERFVVRDGRRWYRTGDRARWTADGEVDLLGRTDRQLKVRGRRIEPGEVEAVLERCEGVLRAAVDAVEVVSGAPVLVGWVQVAGDRQPVGEDPADRLRRELLGELPEWMVPQALVVLDAMPETTTGKIDRGRLPRPRTAFVTGGREPGTPTERRVAAVWAELLGRPVPADESFFALGGQSLLAARMVARLRADFAVDLPMGEVLAAPRVADVAAVIDRLLPEGAPHTEPPAPPPAVAELSMTEVEELLARIDELPEDQVTALLARLGEQ
ncbi:amino acid adenylation domain-containing protein [Blastococcus montanus]|uniref:amino acid adenylation domain-containing protein n=1 Tax=Blastococcus montanus TaxID=3144973 RepID=UPI00320A7F21